MLGASLNELGVVALFVAVVLLASKVGKIGEAVGRLFAGDDKSSAPASSKGSEPRGEKGGE